MLLATSRLILGFLTILNSETQGVRTRVGFELELAGFDLELEDFALEEGEVFAFVPSSPFLSSSLK